MHHGGWHGDATPEQQAEWRGKMVERVSAKLDLNAEQKAERLTVEVLPKKLDEEVALEMVRGFGGVVTQLTKQQADYIGVTVEGPFKPETYRY